MEEDSQEPREYPEWMIAHSDFGAPKCGGLLLPVERGDETDIQCTECDAVVRTVPTADARRVLNEMELAQDFASEMCPHCGSVNLFPGFSRMFSFTCRRCGDIAKVAGS